MLKVLKCFHSARYVSHNANQLRDMKFLNVAEKHDAAKTIAGLLSNGAARRREGYSVYNKVFDFEAQVRGQNAKMVMTSVSGHLMRLEFLASYRNWHSVDPKSLFDAPVRKTVGDDYKPIKRTLEREIRGCQGLIIWTDCDREGENIGYEIIEVCRAAKPNLTVYRATFSEITTAAVRRALQQLGQPDKRQSDAVDVRTELDLRTGAAITRFQTMRLQRLFPEKIADKLISYGSCQIPTLGFVAERYKEIEAFVSEPFWKIRVLHTIDELTVEFNWARNRLFDKEACENYLLLCLADPRAKVESVTVKPKHKWRPTPLDTVEMEKLGSRKLKLSAKETMTIAEKLYTKGIISYPRTETNQFSKEFDLKPLVEHHTSHSNWGEFAQRVIEWGPNPRNGSKSDQAHPPIHPTKMVTDLQGNEARVYELVVRHFLACISKDAVGSETIVHVDIAGEKFNANGLVIHERNYLDVYVYDKWNAKQIHHYEQGQVFEPTEISLHEGATTAPPLLTEADLIALMDKHGIGTDATHAEHINTIKERGYIGVVDKGCLVPGVIGMGLYEGYDAMELALAKPLLRAEFEADLKRICLGEKDPKLVLTEQIRKYKDAYQQITDKITAMDAKVAQRINETPTAGTISETDGAPTQVLQELFQCPKCKVASLALKPKKNQTGHFIGCLNFPDCKNVVWLPDECKEPSVLEECCQHCGSAYKMLKFKFNTAYYRTLFNAPFGWYKTCLRCDGQFRSTFNINMDSVKAVGAIVSDVSSQRVADRQRTVPPTRQIAPAPPPSGNRGDGTETQSLPKRGPKSKRSTNQTTKKQTTANGSIRNFFTAAQSRQGPATEPLEQFFDSNDAFDEELLIAATMAETEAAAAGLTDDIAAAFAADNDSDFEALVNINSGGGQPPDSPPPPRATATVPTMDNLDDSLTGWMRSMRRAEEEQVPIAWGTKGRATVTPPPKRPRLQYNCNEEAHSNDAVVLCSGCHQPAGLQTVRRDGPNKGRNFYNCPKPNKCKFFQWADEPVVGLNTTPASRNNSSFDSSTNQTSSSWGSRNNQASSSRGNSYNRSTGNNEGGCNDGWGTSNNPSSSKGNGNTRSTAINERTSNDGGGSDSYAASSWGSGNSRSTLNERSNNSWGTNANATNSWGSSSSTHNVPSSTAMRSNANSTVTITQASGSGNVECKCGKPASSLTVRKDGPNQGRPFYACPTREKSCGFFKWGDEDENQGSASWGSGGTHKNGNSSSSATRGSDSANGGRPRRCGLCRQEGHTKIKCPRKNEFQY